MLNQVSFIGRITNNLEPKKTNDNVYVRFGLALNEKWGDGKERVDYVNIIAWDNLATNLAKFQKKGSLIYVGGKVRTGSYEKNGQKVYTTDFVASQIIFLDSKPQEEVPYPEHPPR